MSSRTVKDGPTVHALAHSLSTVLIYLRETLFKISFTDNTGFLVAVWTKYGPYEDILNALSDLYGRVGIGHFIRARSLKQPFRDHLSHRKTTHHSIPPRFISYH